MICFDKVCVCRDCGRKFNFGVRERDEFNQRGLSDPTQCPDCHCGRKSGPESGRGCDCGTLTVPVRKEFVPEKPSRRTPVANQPLQAANKPLPMADKPAQVAHKPAPATSAPITAFADFKLDPRLLRAVREAGYVTPTPVQLAAIPIGLAGRDLIGTAQTGTGKTAAFVLPILQRLLTQPALKPRTRVIVLTPTRELAEQIKESFNQLGKYTPIRTATVYGGVGMYAQERSLKNGTEVIVACPGRLLDHIGRLNTDFAQVGTLVLDEADRMLDMGFLPSIKRILGCLPRARQNMLFSATFAPELTQLASQTLNDPLRVAVGLTAPPSTVWHALYPCPQHLKTTLLLKLLDSTDTNSVLIFTRTKHRANRVAQQIAAAGYDVNALHSNKSQNQRQLALDDFRLGKCPILVATDIAARGLDVDCISHVINYDIPDTPDAYIHRIGRTGRAERDGDAMTLVTSADNSIVRDIERALGAPIERRKLENFNYTTPGTSRDEFKRTPAPRRAPRPAARQAKAPAKARTSSPAQKVSPLKRSGRPAAFRGNRGR